MRRLSLFALVLMISLFAAAQDATPTAEAESCSTSALKAYYDGLTTEALAAFDAQAGELPDADLLERLYEAGVSLQARMLACGYIPSDIHALPVGGSTPIERVLEVLDTLSADPLRGQLLYLGEEPTSASNDILGCAGCHEGGSIGPATEGTWTRWDEVYTDLPDYADQPFAYFAVDAILYPNAHVSEGYIENLMPTFYGQALTYQDLIDIVAFLESQDQLPED